ncbi:MAG: HAMP domain-containing sensor histidine kinase [Eubacterium sp.]|nr:HAMP domain-containing sensor histidine kinase [Eubacterium sp.]
MFRKLQFRFILISMLSMIAVLTIIIGSINIMNYHSVVTSADQILTMLKENGGTFPDFMGKPGFEEQPSDTQKPDDAENSALNSNNQTSDPEGQTADSGTQTGDPEGQTADSGTQTGDPEGQTADSGTQTGNPEGQEENPGTQPFDSEVEIGDHQFGKKDFGRDDRMSPETPYDTRYFSVTFAEDGTVAETNIDRIAAVDETQAEQLAEAVYKSSRTSGFSGDYRYLAYTDDGSQTIVLFVDCSRSLSSFRSFFFISILVSAIGAAAVFVLVYLLSRRVVRPMQESYDKQKRFITDAGHELRTPLTIIDADVSVQEMDTGSSEWLDDIKAQTKRLAGLTNDLVYLSRMEEGGSQVQIIDFPVSDVVNEITNSYRARAQVEEKELTSQITPMLSLCGDEKAISKLTNILLDNALKYSSEKGKISLNLTKRGKGIELTVTNSVDSIDEKTLEHMFDRFYRADSSRNSQKGGYGIGLSIVSAVVQAHKGKVSAAAPDSHTIRITVVLP